MSETARQEANAPGGGQSTGTPDTMPSVNLHDQLYRYADDLQKLIERQTELEQRDTLARETCTRLNVRLNAMDRVFVRSHDMHVITDASGRVLRCNPACATFASPASLTGARLGDWVLPDSVNNFEKLLAQALISDTNDQEWELRLRREAMDSTPLIVAAQAFNVQGEIDNRNIHWILRDMTRLRELLFESQLTSMVYRGTAEGVMITDIDGDILAVNPAFSRITGYAEHEVIGRRPSMFQSGMHTPEFYVEFWKSLNETGSWQGEIYNRKKSGEVFPEWLTVNAARDEQGRILSYVAVFTDLSRLVRAEKRLAYLAHHDTLTSLPNRLLFQDRLTQALTQAQREAGRFTLIFIDLDRFKQINDTLGHEIGDIVLKETASRLAHSVRAVDTVARLGGDEFVIIGPGLSGAESIGIVCRKIIDAVVQPIELNEHILTIGASLGYASYPDDGGDESTLLKHADAAMYQAKTAGGNNFVGYRSGSPSATPA